MHLGGAWNRGALLSILPALAFASSLNGPLVTRTPATIVLLEDFQTLELVDALCRDEPLDARDMHPGCPEISGRCTHLFSHVVPGFAATLTNDQLLALEACLGPNITYIEQDTMVQKAEGRQVDFASTRSVRSIGNTSTTMYEWLSLAPSHAVSIEDSQEAGWRLPELQGPAWAFEQHCVNLTGCGFHSTDLEGSPASDTGKHGQVSAFEGGSSSVFANGIKAQHVASASWNLDRIDSRNASLDNAYRFGHLNSSGTGRGVTIYMLDSGVRLTHQEFQGWDDNVSRASYGYSFDADGSADPSAADCNGHGSHVASTAAGRSVGLAKEADIVAVKVLDCEGRGTVSQVVAGLDWIARWHTSPAVVTMSLGTQDVQGSEALDYTVRTLVHDHNVTVVVAAGNSNSNSCMLSPANSEDVINVGATDLTDKFEAGDNEDVLYSYTNTGPCLTVFAPGVNIFGACGGQGRCESLNDSAYTWASGTSMAVPHVAGLVAMYLSANPLANPAQVKHFIVNNATPDVLPTRHMLPDTPNLFMYTRGKAQAAALAPEQPKHPPPAPGPPGPQAPNAPPAPLAPDRPSSPPSPNSPSVPNTPSSPPTPDSPSTSASPSPSLLPPDSPPLLLAPPSPPGPQLAEGSALDMVTAMINGLPLNFG